MIGEVNVAISSGKFDPVLATVYKPTITLVNREPTQGTPVTWGQYYIRFPYMARTGSEREVAEQRISHGQIVIRLRRTPKTLQIRPSWYLTHAGLTYHIVKQNKISDRDELEFLTENREDSEVTINA
jgi:hypothetical protein